MQTFYPLGIIVFQLALRWRMTICDGGGTVMPPSWPPCQVGKSSTPTLALYSAGSWMIPYERTQDWRWPNAKVLPSDTKVQPSDAKVLY